MEDQQLEIFSGYLKKIMWETGRGIEISSELHFIIQVSCGVSGCGPGVSTTLSTTMSTPVTTNATTILTTRTTQAPTTTTIQVCSQLDMMIQKYKDLLKKTCK